MDEAEKPTSPDPPTRATEPAPPNPHPLEGRTIVITRAEEKGIVLKKALEALGARVLAIPCIRFGRPLDPQPLYDAVDRIADFNWVLFTSSTAVEIFFEVARERVESEETWTRFQFAVVGPTTASRLASMGIKAERIVVAGTAAALSAALLGPDATRGLTTADRCLFPQADIAREDVQNALRAAKIPLTTVVTYRTLPEPRDKAEPFLEAVESGETIDSIAFASPSAFVNFLEMTAPQGEQAIRERPIPVFSIGPTTSDAIRARGLSIAAQAVPHTSEGLLQAIQGYLGY